MDTHDVAVWCPLCSHQLHNQEAAEVVTCPACHSPVRWESARNLSQGWAFLHEASSRAQAASTRLAEAEAEAEAAHTSVAEAESMTAAWRAYCIAEMRALGGQMAGAGADAVTSDAVSTTTTDNRAASVEAVDAWPPPQAPPPRTGGAHGFPIAVILQVTGAVLLLAAVVVASAVLWGFLNPLGQVGFLIAIVAAAGVVAVVLGRRLPTTGIVLAALTLALAVVVAISLPSRLPALEASWYPTIVLILGAAVFYLAGSWARVPLWQHSGVAAIPLIVAVAVTTLLPSLADLAGPQWLALAAIAFLAAAIALLFAGHQPDADTAITARIGSYLSAGSGGALAAIGFLADLGGAADWRALLGETIAIGMLAYYCYLLSRQVADRTSAVADRTSGMVAFWRSMAVLALTPLPALLFVPGELDQWWLAALLGIAVVAVVAAWTWFANHARDTLGLPTLLAVPCVGLTVAGLWLFAVLGLVAESGEGGLTWLLGAVAGLGWSVVFLVAGVLQHNAASLFTGWFTGVIAWLLLSAGGHTGDTVETAFLPVIAGSLLVWWVARATAVPGISAMPTATPQVIVLAGTFPISMSGWGALLFDERFAPRPFTVSVAAVVVAGVLVWRQHTIWLVTALGAAVLWWPWALSVQVHAATQSLERYTLPFAVAVLIVAVAGAHDKFWRRSQALLVTALIALVPSTVAALVTVASWGEPPQWRSVIVLAVWGLATVWSVSRRPVLAAVSWAVVLVLTCWWAIVALLSGPLSGPERVTLPIAVGAILLAGWLRYPRTWTTWWTHVLAIPLLVVLAVSSFDSVVTDPASAGIPDWIRTGICGIAWVALCVGYWRRPWYTFAFGTVAASFAWLTMLRVLVATDYSGPVEVYTLSAAVAVAFVTYLVTRASSSHFPSILTMGPTIALVLWPSAILAWTGDELGWRIWVALILSAIALVVGVMFRRAGLLVPGLIGIVLVTLPVFLQVVSDLPAWLPLSVVGLILVGIGARFEAVRRGSVEAVRWARHLQ